MKVKYFPFQPHCFAFGGFDLQMTNTLNAVRKAGVDAEKLDIWSRDNDFDIIHLWGVGPNNYQIIYWAKKSGKAIIATILVPYYDTIRSKIGYFYRRFFSDSERLLIQNLNLLDKIVVVNKKQQRILNTYYNVPYSKIEIIPNLIEDKYFEIPHFAFKEKYQVQNYVLCTGNISPRKNQCNLALACINLNANLVLIGKVLDGESAYGNKLESLCSSNKNIVWIKELPNASEELVAAYYNCLIFALPSKNETQPISALEAVAMKKPLVLIDRQYAYQDYYRGAFLCKSQSVKDIEKTLISALNSKGIIQRNNEILNCKEERVGRGYKKCYEKLVRMDLH